MADGNKRFYESKPFYCIIAFSGCENLEISRIKILIPEEINNSIFHKFKYSDEVLDFVSWAMNHICANDEYRSEVDATKDVFSFHLQIFHWFIASPSPRYFQGHSP
jgi:hypothetical protein